MILDERKVNAGVDDAKNASDHLLDGFKSMLGDNDNDNDEDEDDLEVNSPSIGVSPYFPVVFIMYSLASSTFLLLSHLAFERSVHFKQDRQIQPLAPKSKGVQGGYGVLDPLWSSILY